MKTDKKRTRGKVSAAKKKKAPAKKRTTAKKPAAPKRKAPRKPETAPRGAPAENPAALALSRKIADLLLDKKAQDVVILDVRGIASYADYVVIGSGESDRQVTAMADNVETKLKQEDGLTPVGSEGQETGQWVLLDYGDVVAHLFYGETRGHYDLEGVLADAPREPVR